MERLDTNVRTLDGALQETPEVLQAIRVYIILHVGFRRICDLVIAVIALFLVWWMLRVYVL